MALISLRKVLGLQPDHAEALEEIQEVQKLAIEERKNIAREQEQQQQQLEEEQDQHQPEAPASDE